MYYSRRWTIEIFFKDAKQMLYLGKEQSSTFDAVIACYHLVMIRYLILVNIMNRLTLTGPIGPLFRDLVDDQLLHSTVEKLWSRIRELLIDSSRILLDEIEVESFLQLIEIVEEKIVSKQSNFPAKL